MPESDILKTILNRIDQLDDKFSGKFNHLDHRLDNVESRLVNVEDKLEEVDNRFDKVDDRFDEMDHRFDKMDDRFDKMDDRLDMIYEQTVRLTLGQTAMKIDINEIKSVYNYLNNEVARNSKDIYVMKDNKN